MKRLRKYAFVADELVGIVFLPTVLWLLSIIRIEYEWFRWALMVITALCALFVAYRFATKLYRYKTNDVIEVVMQVYAVKERRIDDIIIKFFEVEGAMWIEGMEDRPEYRTCRLFDPSLMALCLPGRRLRLYVLRKTDIVKDMEVLEHGQEQIEMD